MITKKAVYSQTAFFHLDQRKFLQPPEDHYCIYVSTAFERIKPGQKNYPFQLFPSGCIPLSLPPQICVRRFFWHNAECPLG